MRRGRLNSRQWVQLVSDNAFAHAHLSTALASIFGELPKVVAKKNLANLRKNVSEKNISVLERALEELNYE
jgi:hypothetical protein